MRSDITGKLTADATLVGHRVLALYVTEGEDILVIVTDRHDEGGPVLLLDTAGDCCSTSWWADVVGVKQLVNATVTAVEGIELDTYDVNDGRTRQDEDIAYGERIHTDRGSCDLIYRNSSNGYYGGWCKPRWSANVPAGARPITEDWRA